MDRGAWWATVHKGHKESDTTWSDLACLHMIHSSVNDGFPDGPAVKGLPVMQETQAMRVWSLGREDAPEEELVTCSSILPWTPTDRGAWWAAADRVAKSQIQLSRNTMSVSHIYHVVHYIPRTNLSYNWKFLPLFFIQVSLPYLPISGNHKSDLFFEVQFFIIFEV